MEIKIGTIIVCADFVQEPGKQNATLKIFDPGQGESAISYMKQKASGEFHNEAMAMEITAFTEKNGGSFLVRPFNMKPPKSA